MKCNNDSRINHYIIRLPSRNFIEGWCSSVQSVAQILHYITFIRFISPAVP